MKIPCPSVTANAAEADRQQAMVNGFTDYITKPYKRNLLVSMQQAIDAAKEENSTPTSDPSSCA
jgi:CheY-like chemotaxis protein